MTNYNDELRNCIKLLNRSAKLLQIACENNKKAEFAAKQMELDVDSTVGRLGWFMVLDLVNKFNEEDMDLIRGSVTIIDHYHRAETFGTKFTATSKYFDKIPEGEQCPEYKPTIKVGIDRVKTITWERVND